ncbi:MAG: RloB domain-containing protein [Deltaproteobacteria bacterium]|nr:RloB domain-containing protein [Deltaproteobacteria bacterium]
MAKAWQRKRDYSRRENTRPIRDRILILCEGKKTETNYFRNFSEKIDLVEVEVKGTGANTASLVEEAIRLRQDAETGGRPYNQIWCVFDRDSFPPGNFNRAFSLAYNNHIRIAYSNQCFELWYLLHYHFNDAAIDRHKYGKMLSKYIGRKYRKNDEGMYNLLKAQQAVAIRNAERLLGRYHRCNPEKDDPSTTVHKLVNALNEFLSEDSSEPDSRKDRLCPVK